MKKQLIAKMVRNFLELDALTVPGSTVLSVTMTDDRGASGAVRFTQEIMLADGRIVEDVHDSLIGGIHWVSTDLVQDPA